MADLPAHEDHTGRQRTAALVDVVVGAGVLGIGWWMDVAQVRQVLPGQESMKANTAVGLLLLGVAALPWSRRRPVRQVAGVLLLFQAIMSKCAQGMLGSTKRSRNNAAVMAPPWGILPVLEMSAMFGSIYFL